MATSPLTAVCIGVTLLVGCGRSEPPPTTTDLEPSAAADEAEPAAPALVAMDEAEPAPGHAPSNNSAPDEPQVPAPAPTGDSPSATTSTSKSATSASTTKSAPKAASNPSQPAPKAAQPATALAPSPRSEQSPPAEQPRPSEPPPASTPPTTPTAAAPTAAPSKVVVPRTATVRVEVPPGLQARLDSDRRMQPWVNTAVSVLDRCYAAEREKDPAAKGIAELSVTMQPNARPKGDIISLPSQLNGMLPCAMAGLMSPRMPLFTGPEGETHRLRIHFGK